MNNLIQLSNLNKTFVTEKKINVLKKINYKFKKGKIYSLMGPSGSGKSTLLNLLSLIDRPSSGSISIENNNIDFKNSKKNDLLRAKKIGIIYQQDNLLSDFTAIENIYLANLAAGNDKESSIAKSKILLRKVGLSSRANHYPSQLSGGEKQRVSIARALINDPQIILADEPTGSLDLETAKGVFEILKKQINPNRLIIFATHNRFFADKSDCLLEIVNGSIKTING
ncbi:ABC transporter ATP-binding protein [Candidatus Pelagibacter sp. HIMB1483]|uniref:ABC transporter ATP-binding protein n=1 Tax=Candidatus Pelagibacter sp. HIMB1483 TaxID=3415414 RepID=UPI003F861362